MVVRILEGDCHYKDHKKNKRNFLEELREIGKNIRSSYNNLKTLQMTPHTRAKHIILCEYLQRWYPILASWNEKLVYIDGFAGSGIYDDYSMGSPVIAYYTFLTHDKYMLNGRPGVLFNTQAEFIFMDKDKEAVDTLQIVLSGLQKILKNKGIEISKNVKYRIINGEFETVANHILSRLNIELSKPEERKALFVFIDPYGYTGYKIETIVEFLKYPGSSEILLNLMTGFMSRFINDKQHLDVIKSSFKLAEDDVERISNLSDSEEKSKMFANLVYKKIYEMFKSSDKTGRKILYQNFSVLNINNVPLYELIHLTKHEKGIRAMKESMREASNIMGLKFSDYYFDPNATPITRFLYSSRTEEENRAAANLVYEEFYKKRKKHKVTQMELEKFIDLETPYIYRQGILKILEKEGKIKIVDERNLKRNLAKLNDNEEKKRVFIIFN